MSSIFVCLLKTHFQRVPNRNTNIRNDNGDSIDLKVLIFQFKELEDPILTLYEFPYTYFRYFFLSKIRIKTHMKSLRHREVLNLDIKFLKYILVKMDFHFRLRCIHIQGKKRN